MKPLKAELDLIQGQLRAAFKGDRSSVLWIAKFGAVLAVFGVVFYPLQRDLAAVSANKSSLKEQIKNLQSISTGMLTPKELIDTRMRLEQFAERIADTSQAAALLDLITNEAEKNHLNIIQIYSDSPQPAKDEQGRELDLAGRKLFWIGVNFRVESDYKSLGNFLKSLNDASKWEYVVESMLLQKTPEADSLQCDMTLNFIAQ